jgi:hypothetical protein
MPLSAVRPYLEWTPHIDEHAELAQMHIDGLFMPLTITSDHDRHKHHGIIGFRLWFQVGGRIQIDT